VLTIAPRVHNGSAIEKAMQPRFARPHNLLICFGSLVGAQEAACNHRISDIGAQTSLKSHIGAKRQFPGVTNLTQELGLIAPSSLQTEALRATLAKAARNAIAGTGPTAPSAPQTDTLRAMLVKAAKRRGRPA
jgi:hypothetical protein